jgi:hypothetical protein
MLPDQICAAEFSVTSVSPPLFLSVNSFFLLFVVLDDREDVEVREFGAAVKKCQFD